MRSEHRVRAAGTSAPSTSIASIASITWIASAILASAAVHAQPAQPAQQGRAPAPLAAIAEIATQLLPAQPGEAPLIPSLRGIVLVNSPEEARRGVGGGAGLDTSRIALQGLAELQQISGYFIGKPASLASVERVVFIVQNYLRLTGRRFATVYLPPQDLKDGSVRIVVQSAKLEGAVRVEGATHFSPAQYAGVLGIAPGEPLDGADFGEAIDRLNRNPFRRASVVVEPGTQPGTSKLVLRLDEKPPLAFNAGADNSGTAATGQSRIFAGVNWADAFGRGDQLGYQL